MTTKTKRDFAELLTAQSRARTDGGPKLTQAETADVIERLLQAFMDTLASGDRIEIRDFGVFEPVVRKERMAQNPKTLEKVRVPGRMGLRFKLGKILKARLRTAAIATT